MRENPHTSAPSLAVLMCCTPLHSLWMCCTNPHTPAPSLAVCGGSVCGDVC